VLPDVGLKAATRFAALTSGDALEGDVQLTWDTALNARFDRNCQVDRVLSMSKGERGCAASHVALWRQCVASEAPLLVLEDDVVFSSPRVGEWTCCLVSVVEAALAPAERSVVLYLGAEAELRAGAPTLRGKQAIWAARTKRVGCELREALWAWQTHAYVLWPAAARILLAGLPVDAPVDVYLSRHYHERRLCGLVCEPMLATQADPYCGGDVEHSSLRDRERMCGWGAGCRRRQAS